MSAETDELNLPEAERPAVASGSAEPSASFETSASHASQDEVAAPPKSFWARNEHALLGTFSMGVFLVFWEMSVVLGWVNPLFTSAPSRILRTGYEMFADGSIYPHLQVSGYEFIVGYGTAIIIGVPLGILMGWYGRVNAVLDPFVSALYATPRIALLPLVMIWFGIGLMSKVAIVFLGAIFPILVNTITGVRTVNADFVKVARSFGSNDWQMFLTVVLPSSVPLLLTGLRLGLGHALVGIVVGEMYGATHGLGFLIATAGARFQTDKVMVGIIIIAAAGIVMTGLLRLIERRFERWRPTVGG
jgi:NitT/TauT family transport system permease protein